ncbi:PorV/PorQ family protein, partial [bacterium]|nr:PorV/PorQ family protein [bacterium]
YNEVTLMHSNWLPQFKFNDLYYDFLSYVHQVEDWGTFGANVIFLNLGESIRTDETGRELGTFNSYELAVTGSYGSPITNDEKMAVGVNMRFIYSNLSPVGAGSEKGTGTATSVGVDIGWLWHSPIKNLNLGANLSNMGPKVAYIDRAQADPLPTNLKAGFAYHVINSEYNRLTFVGDVNKELVRRDADTGDPDHFYIAMFTAWGDGDLIETLIYNTGLEYWYSDLIALRVGHWNDQLGNVKPTTFGASLKYNLYRFDLSYVAAGEGHPLQDTMRFSLTVGF